MSDPHGPHVMRVPHCHTLPAHTVIHGGAAYPSLAAALKATDGGANLHDPIRPLVQHVRCSGPCAVCELAEVFR